MASRAGTVPAAVRILRPGTWRLTTSPHEEWAATTPSGIPLLCASRHRIKGSRGIGEWVTHGILSCLVVFPAMKSCPAVCANRSSAPPLVVKALRRRETAAVQHRLVLDGKRDGPAVATLGHRLLVGSRKSFTPSLGLHR